MVKKFIRFIAFSCPVFLLVAFVAVAHAAGPDATGSGGTALRNPLTVDSIANFVAAALRILVMVSLPIVTLFLVISGFLFITAQGNQQKLETAKKNFFFVIIGTLLILGAWLIATLIAGTVTQLTTG